MARRRDYAQEHAERNRLARERGFRNYAEQRRHARRPSRTDQLLGLPERAKDVRSDVARALDHARLSGEQPLDTARRLGVTRGALTWWGDEALARSPGGLSLNRRDIARLRPVVVEGGTELFAVRGWKRREAEQIFDIQWRALSDEATIEELEWLRGRKVGGRAVVSDEAQLLELGRRGLVDPREASGRGLS
jgi:hypothetical protein